MAAPHFPAGLQLPCTHFAGADASGFRHHHPCRPGCCRQTSRAPAWTIEDAFLAIFSAFATGLLIVVLTDYSAKRALATTLDRTLQITKSGLRMFPDHRSIKSRLDLFRDPDMLTNGDSLYVLSSSAKSWLDLNPETEAFRLLSYLASQTVEIRVVIFSPVLYFEALLEPLCLDDGAYKHDLLKKLLNGYRFSRYQNTGFELLASHQQIRDVLVRISETNSVDLKTLVKFTLNVKVTGDLLLTEFNVHR